MAIFRRRKIVLAFVLTGPFLALSGCEPTAGNTGGSVYYDSMLWNDYYYGRPGTRPPDPGRPEHPIAPAPPRPTPPIARPPAARPPIHRPSRGRF